MKITVIGAGNAGCAHSAKLVENGHSVILVKTSKSMHEENFSVMEEKSGISVIDNTNGENKFFAKIEVTRDIDYGIQNADVILILTQSLQHKQLAALIAEKFIPGQIVLLIPGNMGSIHFRKSAHPDVVFIEGESTPFDARIESPGLIRILFKNHRNALSLSPNKGNNDFYLNIIDKLFGAHKFLRSNIVESALHNPNMVVHTVGVIMSASRIEYANGEFWMYRESFSPSIWNLIAELDKEKNSVIESYGGTALSYLDACKWRNEEDLNMDSLAVFQGYAEDGGPKGPNSLDTRFIYEDVPMGLCLLKDLASKVNIKTPVTDSLITIISSIMQVDYCLEYEKHSAIKDASFDEVSMYL